MNPKVLAESLALLRGQLATGELDQALLKLDASHIDAPALAWTKFEILIRFHRLDDARREFDCILQNMEDPAVLTSLLVFAPQLHEGWRRTEVWLALLDKAERFANRTRVWAEPLNVVSLRLLLALRNYHRFLAAIAEIPAQSDLGDHRASLLAVAAALRKPSFPDYRMPKIFGIGLSRTGTTSLAAALSAIGFNTLHWFNPLTCELISDDDLHLFDAFTDTPVCANFERYYYTFPHSKFIYTTRPLEEWKRSVIGHFKRLTGFSDFHEFKTAISRSDMLPYGTAFSSVHHSLYFNHADYESAYHAHDRRVRRFFQDKPRNRFLEFDLFGGHGWQELCAFTGRSVPSMSYPRENPLPSVSEVTCPYADASNDRRRVFGYAAP